MTKSELIAKIAASNKHLYAYDAERLVNTVFEEISKALAEVKRVELRGFGAFSVRERGARVGRNPKTGVTVSVEPKSVPFFKAGKALKAKVLAGKSKKS